MLSAYPRDEPTDRYPNSDTTTVTYGGVTYLCSIVTNEDRLVCPLGVCTKRFDSETGLKIHMNAMHNKSPLVTGECLLCGDEMTYNPDRHEQTYCSIDCANKARGTQS